MKKLINEPDAVVREALEGIEAAHGDRLRVILRPVRDRARRRARAGQGRDHLRRRLGPRADARRLRRPRDARRGLPGRGLHLADAGPDARGDQGRRRRRRRAAHRQELHRRRAELRDGRRSRQGRGHRGRGGRDQRRRRGPGQPLHRRPPRRRHHRDRREDLRRGRRGGQVARGGRRAVPQGQRPGPQHGHGAHALHHAGLRRAELRAGRRRDGDRHRHPRRAGPPPREARAGRRRSSSAWRRRSSRTCRTSPATACSRSSTAWAARR